jgi:hypothetical protein
MPVLSCARGSKRLSRALRTPFPTAVLAVGVDHRGGDVLMAEEPLYGADIQAVLKECVAKGTGRMALMMFADR